MELPEEFKAAGDEDGDIEVLEDNDKNDAAGATGEDWHGMGDIVSTPNPGCFYFYKGLLPPPQGASDPSKRGSDECTESEDEEEAAFFARMAEREQREGGGAGGSSSRRDGVKHGMRKVAVQSAE
eukprot:scaffold147109_cov14-Tisochrysis_lutea.AAC.1